MLRRFCILFLVLAALPGHAEVILEIRHLWNGKPLEVPSGELAIESGEKIDVTRLAYLLSGPRLRRQSPGAKDGEWIRPREWFAYVDASQSAGGSRIKLGRLPAGKYDALEFHVGLDERTDRSDPNQYPAGHALNPVLNNLHWTPQGGFIFFALEGHLQDSAGAGGFAYHLGNSWNRMTVRLPAAMELNDRALVVLDFHLDRLFNSTPALKVAARSTTHSRKGDPAAALLKDRVESAFAFREVGRVKTEASPPPSSPPKLIGTPYKFRVARGFPIPKLPTDYPLTNERVRLGLSLFYEMKLSRSNTQACASCHNPTYALSDTAALSTGDGGQKGTRNAMPLFNLAWKDSFFWDGRAPSLRKQAVQPIENPLEMHESLDHVIGELEQMGYPRRFARAFGTPEVTAERIGIALEQYLLTQTSFDSRFDRAARNEGTLTAQEKRGFELFMTEYDPRRGLKGADCFHCHGSALFTDHRFHNNGLKDEKDPGLAGVTGKAADRNKFITPSLRNIALTAPYMHDGRFETLEEVVEHYDSGPHRSATLDPNLAKHPRGGLGLSADDKAALVAFLKTLTDPRFGD